MLTYEAMHERPEEPLAEALRFLSEHPDPKAIAVAIERARIDRMKAMEKGGAFESGRSTPADRADANSLEVRCG